MKKIITVSRKATYFVQEPNDKVRHILYVIHGYAQRADDFLIEFEKLKSHGILVIAPEALSKFYNKKREAVASWMTKRDRLNEIDDYKSYLSQLHQSIKANYKNVGFSILGFSQGVSTALRWLTELDDIHSFYACSGSIPPELNSSDFSNQSQIQGHFYYGSNDKLFSAETAKMNLEKLNNLNLDFKVFHFEGGHQVPEICLEHLKTI